MTLQSKDPEKKPSGSGSNIDSLYNEIKSFISERRKEKKPSDNSKKPHHPSKQKKKTFSKPQGNKQVNRGTRGRRKESLEPRDMHHFVMKSRSNNQKSFPYLTPKQAFEKFIPQPKEVHRKRADKNVLRILPFGGLEQVGLNCIGFEYNNEILIIDMGIQFPDEHMHGVGGRIPDLSYLRGKKVVGIAITHGHIDHIGAVPYLMRELGTHIPFYAPPMAMELIKTKQEEFKMPLENMKGLKKSQVSEIGQHFYIEPFTVDHSIPDSFGIRIHTPVGKFIHTGDWKFDSDPMEESNSTDHEQLKQFGKEGIRALLSDSTNAHMTGSSIAEKLVIEPIEKIFQETSGRIITGTFSSIIDRLQIIVDTARKFNRKVVLLGRGMNIYFDIAKKLGHVNVPQGTIIEMKEAQNLPDNQVCICCTGAQGERYAALMRIATGESKDTEFKPGDTVVLSSSVIPGNERKVQELMDILYEQKVNIHHYRQSTIHSGGHAREEDIKIMIDEIQPEYFVPIYGGRFQIMANAEIAKKMGYKDEKIFIARNGQIMEFTKDSAKLTNYFTSHKMITVDGALIGFTAEREFGERYQMLKGGIIIINITQKRDGPKAHLIGHGFIDFNKFPKLQEEIVEAAIKTYKEGKKNREKRDDINRSIRRKAQAIIWSKALKEPVVIVAS